MQVRFQSSPKETASMSTQETRANFLIQDLMVAGEIKLIYSHYDRVIVGGVVPTSSSINLPNEEELKANFFLERREMGIINVGGKGKVVADGVAYELDKLSCVYLGKGTKEVSFTSEDSKIPALFYVLSTPSHAVHPNKSMTKTEASPVNMGDFSTSNKRRWFAK